MYVPYFAMRRYLDISRHAGSIPRIVQDSADSSSGIFAYGSLLDDGCLHKLGVFYTIKKNYRMDRDFSLVEIAYERKKTQ